MVMIGLQPDMRVGKGGSFTGAGSRIDAALKVYRIKGLWRGSIPVASTGSPFQRRMSPNGNWDFQRGMNPRRGQQFRQALLWHADLDGRQ